MGGRDSATEGALAFKRRHVDMRSGIGVTFPAVHASSGGCIMSNSHARHCNFLPAEAFHLNLAQFLLQYQRADVSAQVWADKLAVAEDTDALCDVIRELYQQEDIPYGSLPALLPQF